MEPRFELGPSTRGARRVRLALIGTLTLGLACACASNPTKRSVPVTFVPAAEPAADLVLARDASLRLDAGSVRGGLPAGSTWRRVGTIPQGAVYDPLDWELVVSGKHSFEGYLVLDDDAAVGVYLPFESAFVGARSAVQLELH